MFDIAPTELLLIVVVAVLVIGPKDMPIALRAVGRWIGQIRRISGHFRSGLDAMIREAEMQEMEQKWREQNEKILREHPANTVAEPEPTGAYPAQEVMQPLAQQPQSQTGAQEAGSPPHSPAADAHAHSGAVSGANAEARIADLAAVQGRSATSASAAATTGGAVAVAAGTEAAAPVEPSVQPSPAPQTAPVLPGASSAQSAAEPVSAEARAAAIAAATGGSFDGLKG